MTFTDDELKTLAEALKLAIGVKVMYENADDMQTLEIKVQTMIDDWRELS